MRNGNGGGLGSGFGAGRGSGFVSGSGRGATSGVLSCSVVRRCRRKARGGVALAVVARTDPKQRIVITGQGIVSAFGNDVETFYEK